MIARINDPRNQPYFDLLGISPTVSATGAIMGLIEHEVPEHGLIQLLELRKENLEIVEVTVDKGANCQGKRVRALRLPEGARLISVVRDGKAEIPDEETQLEAGDQVLAILEPGKEDELRRAPAARLSVPENRPRGALPSPCASPGDTVLLAWFATVAGLISIVSALTPEAADRVRLIGGVLPPGVPEAARTIALALGPRDDLLLARARSAQAPRLVPRGRDRDRLGARAPREGPRLRGGDRPPAVARRPVPVAPSFRRAGRPGDGAAARAGRSLRSRSPPCSSWSCIYDDDDVLGPHRGGAGCCSSAALGFRALWLWLRPLPVVPPCAEDRERATELVQEHGTDSLAYFALRRDKSYFFSPSGRSFLAYRVIGGTALVAGDPIGEAHGAGRADE